MREFIARYKSLKIASDARHKNTRRERRANTSVINILQDLGQVANFYVDHGMLDVGPM